MLPRPPRSTRFPYTTLFRSRAAWRADHRDWRKLSALRLGCCSSRGRGARCRGLDRKSTRLNSSHLGISYAVFCLKKKKKKQLRAKTSTESHRTNDRLLEQTY